MINPLSQFFESVPPGEEPINQFQYVDGKDFHPLKWVSFALFQDYIKDTTGNWIARPEKKYKFINDFLDYHFSKYSGDPEEFFYYLKYLITEAHDLYKFDFCKPIIEKWIERESTERKKVNRPEVKINDFPPFTECFRDKGDFKLIILNNPKVSELYETKDGLYYWKKGKKQFLSGLGVQLLNKNKLIESIETNQDVAKVFCTFFNVDFDPIDERQFHNDRAKTDYFKEIK